MLHCDLNRLWHVEIFFFTGGWVVNLLCQINNTSPAGLQLTSWRNDLGR